MEIDLIQEYGICGCEPGLIGEESITKKVKDEFISFRGMGCCLELRIDNYLNQSVNLQHIKPYS